MTGDKEKRFTNQSILRKVARMIWTGISVVLACIFVFIAVLMLISLGKPTPILDNYGHPLAGSLSEKVFIDINGVKQGMFIQSSSSSNPVLLILHGGMPEYFLTQKYPTGLENIFTVVWWEQRGSGISYIPDIPRETMTAEQMISDTLAVTNYFRNRFNQEKIYLMGHSGGSFIGIQAAMRAPELYYAYIGQSQIANQLKSEKLAYDYMLQQFKENGNTRMARKLEAAPVTIEGGVPAAYRFMLRDDAMHRLGIGTIHTMNSFFIGIFLSFWQSPAYTFGEKVNMWRGKAQAGISILFDTMVTTDLSQEVTEFTLPVYFIEGVYDYTCNYSLAKDYFEKIQAPIKGFYTFQQSAHSPMFEEPQKMQKILREDVLAGANNLADGR